MINFDPNNFKTKEDIQKAQQKVDKIKQQIGKNIKNTLNNLENLEKLNEKAKNINNLCNNFNKDAKKINKTFIEYLTSCGLDVFLWGLFIYLFYYFKKTKDFSKENKTE